MQKIEVVVRITKDHCPPQEQTIFEWFDLMRNPTDALRSPGLEINLEHHRVFKHGTEVYMSRYEYCTTSKTFSGIFNLTVKLCQMLCQCAGRVH